MIEKPLLILVPGLLCDGFVWAAQAEALRSTHEVVALGFLDFDSIEAMAEHVLAVASRPFALAGFSMGGRVALEVVRRAPERVRRLALLDTGAGPTRPQEAEARGRLVTIAKTEGMEALAAVWLPPMVGPGRRDDAALMVSLSSMVGRASPALFERQIRAMLTRPDAEPVLGSIRCPAALMVGRHDGWSPLAQHEAMAAAIPGARLTVIEDSGHFAPVEQPGAVSAALQAWLAYDLAK